MMTVFSLDHLNVDSELDLFNAAIRYAKAQDKRNSERSISPPSEIGPPNEKRPKSPEPSTSKDKVSRIAIINFVLCIFKFLHTLVFNTYLLSLRSI